MHMYATEHNTVLSFFDVSKSYYKDDDTRKIL